MSDQDCKHSVTVTLSNVTVCEKCREVISSPIGDGWVLIDLDETVNYDENGNIRFWVEPKCH